jgi:hypothetical protein
MREGGVSTAGSPKSSINQGFSSAKALKINFLRAGSNGVFVLIFAANF